MYSDPLTCFLFVSLFALYHVLCSLNVVKCSETNINPQGTGEHLFVKTRTLTTTFPMPESCNILELLKCYYYFMLLGLKYLMFFFLTVELGCSVGVV